MTNNILNLTEMRKTQILNAATEIFAKDGYEKANTDHIAKMANLGKGTIYRYFKNKESLFISVVAQNFKQLADAVTKSIKAQSDPIKQIESLIRGFLCFFDKNPKFRTIMIQVHEQSNIHKKMADMMFLHYCKEMKKFEIVFKNGIKSNIIKKINIESAINILMSILSGILHMHIFHKKNQKLIHSAPTICKVFFTGIINDKNRRIKYATN